MLPLRYTRTWIETDFQELVRSRCAAVVSKTGRMTAMSSSHGILTVLKAWNGLCDVNEVFSLGVLCSGNDSCIDISILKLYFFTGLFATVNKWFFSASYVGYYDLPDGVVLSIPLTFTDGKWSILSDVNIGVDLKERLQLSANEIIQFLKPKSNKECRK